jgi:hypothetical protein
MLKNKYLILKIKNLTCLFHTSGWYVQANLTIKEKNSKIRFSRTGYLHKDGIWRNAIICQNRIGGFFGMKYEAENLIKKSKKRFEYCENSVKWPI